MKRNKIKSLKKMEPVFVEWVDSRATGNYWENIDSIEPLEVAKCKTYGFVVEINKQYLTVASTISKEQILCRLTIPVPAIIRIKRNV